MSNSSDNIIRDPNAVSIKRALISVSDKDGVADFAKALSDYGVEILSTGGTAKMLSEEGIAVKDVSDETGFPEIMMDVLKHFIPKFMVAFSLVAMIKHMSVQCPSMVLKV